MFTATMGRDRLIARRLRETADKLCEGSLTPLLTHLVSDPKLSEEEIEALRDLVERVGSDRETTGSEP